MLRNKQENQISILGSEKARETYHTKVFERIDKTADDLNDDMLLYFKDQADRIVKFMQENPNNIISGIDKMRETEEEEAIKVAFPHLLQVALQAGNQAAEQISDAKEKSVHRKDAYVIQAALFAILQQRSDFFAGVITTTTFNSLTSAIAQGITDGEGLPGLTRIVRSTIDDIAPFRARMIAQTESTFANNAGFQDAYDQFAEVEGKEWIAILDGRVRPEHEQLNGTVVRKNQRFPNGLEFPQEPNCRCTVAPVIAQL